MRAVLRTIAQCHSHHILHRDIKPGNFMLLDYSDRSPLVAIDFGLAMPYNPEELPCKDLGLEGTPWWAAAAWAAAKWQDSFTCHTLHSCLVCMLGWDHSQPPALVIAPRAAPLIGEYTLISL